MISYLNTSWLPNQMISLIWIFGFLCRSSLFRYPDELRDIVQQCATSSLSSLSSCSLIWFVAKSTHLMQVRELERPQRRKHQQAAEPSQCCRQTPGSISSNPVVEPWSSSSSSSIQWWSSRTLRSPPRLQSWRQTRIKSETPGLLLRRPNSAPVNKKLLSNDYDDVVGDESSWPIPARR